MSSKLVAVLDRIDKRELLIRASTSFNWELDVVEQNVEMFCYCALHCIVNGPVGVNKVTNWPGKNAPFSAKSLCQKLSNSMWKHFCSVVEAELVLLNDPILKCSRNVELYGSTWPSCEKAMQERISHGHYP
jgi:hypothetical protein